MACRVISGWVCGCIVMSDRSALDQEAGAGGLESLSLPHVALWGNVTEEGYVLP